MSYVWYCYYDIVWSTQTSHCSFLSGAQDLEHVDLSNNQLTEFSTMPFSKNRVLKKLDMSYNDIWTIADVDLLEVRTI